MNKSTRTMLAAVMTVAIVLMLVLGLGYIRDGKLLKDKQTELSVSQAAWEKTAADKEAMQADLKVITNDIKEAEQTIKESTERAAELREENAQLQADIDALKNGTGQ